MDRVRQILSITRGLSENELKRISDALLAMLGKTTGVYGASVKKAEKCRKCGADQIVKFGKDKNGKQRYKCKCCGATFIETSFSAISHTRHSDSVWADYIHLLLKGASLEECAFRCRISVRTAFIWRHKLLNAIQNDQDNRIMAGIVEADEMFIPVSYKGNHKKSKRFTMPRKPFRRGTDNRSNTVPKACVMCAVERKGQSYAEVLGTGQLTKKMATYAFTGRIATDSIVLSDRTRAMKSFFDTQNDTQLIRMQSTADGSRHSKIPEVKGIYHIQTVNNFHKRLGYFLRRYNGVSTKYLNHYVSLFVWIENHKQMKVPAENTLMEFIIKESIYTSPEMLFCKPPVPLVA